VVEGRHEETELGVDLIQKAKAVEIVFLVSNDHEANPMVTKLERKLGKRIRRFRKPATPSILRESLFPGQSKAIRSEVPTAKGTRRISISSPDEVNEHGNVSMPKTHFDEESMRSPPGRPRGLMSGLSQLWKPNGQTVEDAVASLCLGDYFSSRLRTSLVRTPSNASSIQGSSNEAATPISQSEEAIDTPPTESQPDSSATEAEPEPIKVLVVEDNKINRKILVKILSTKIASGTHPVRADE